MLIIYNYYNYLFLLNILIISHYLALRTSNNQTLFLY